MLRWNAAAGIALLLFLAGWPPSSSAQAQPETASAADQDAAGEDADPPEVAIGERLFLETRFAQFFAANASDINVSLAEGDPLLNEFSGLSVPGAFAGQSMNCRACHLVDEALEAKDGGMRAYNDFAARPRQPVRPDGKSIMVRNSPQMLGIFLQQPGTALFHFDGEFPSLETLVAETLTGRKFGWLPPERDQATAHIARVIREDDGKGELARQFGGPYKAVLGGRSEGPEFALPERFRIDVDAASDHQILAAVSLLIAEYMRSLDFIRDEAGFFNGSPYDRFLELNDLPRSPEKSEEALAYARRLLRSLPTAPRFVEQGEFRFHRQRFVFGPQELHGLRVFFAEQPADRERLSTGVGNCVACHAPPLFTDFGLHNTGVSQREYDEVHGGGIFAKLRVPTLSERAQDLDRYLPSGFARPSGKGPFRAIPVKDRPGLADLGAWSIFANPDFPQVQAALKAKLCAIPREPTSGCTDDQALALAVAAFKTPSLRDLGHSDPYMHSGAFATLEDAVRFYRDTALLSRAQAVRDPDPRLLDIALSEEDIAALASFLRALNEDYE